MIHHTPYEWLAYIQAPITWIVFFAGLILGSFLNVCINRIPEGTFWNQQRSHCPHCSALIPWWLNIPVLSFLYLRGRAKCCDQHISWQYPLVEILTGVLMVICYWNFPFLTAIPTWDIEPRDLIRFIHAMIFVNVLIVCSVIDLKHMIIPDVISLPMIALSPVVIYFHPELDWQSSLMGILLGGGVLYGITWAYWLVRHEIGMGMGDVKLLAAIGGWLGYQSILPTIFYGSVLGSTVGIVVLLMSRKFSLQTKIPFGPFLAIGAILHLFLNEFFYELLFIP